MSDSPERRDGKLGPLTLARFAPAKPDDWRAEAEASLDGAPFEKKLMTATPEGIALSPIYDAASAVGLPHVGIDPGYAPFARGVERGGGRPWMVSQAVEAGAAREANAELSSELARGTEVIHVVLDRATERGVDPDVGEVGEVMGRGVSVATIDDLGALFEGVDVGGRELFVDCGDEALAFVALLLAWAGRHDGARDRLTGCVGADPLGRLVSRGRLRAPIDGAYGRMASLARWAAANTPGLRTVIVSGRPYHEAGGSAVEELGFALATAVEYVRAMADRGLPIDEAARAIEVELCVGSVFFMELAKLRAARILWATAMEALGATDAACRISLRAATSSWTATATDPWVNMLRATTQTFCAAISGARAVTTSPYDAAIKAPDEFSSRVARNTQMVLRDESRLGHVVDPAGGSWYVERLTDQVARAAWDLFREVEREGGMTRAVGEGMPQRRVRATADERLGRLATRRSTLIGTNMYPNLAEGDPPTRDLAPREAVEARAREVARWRTEGHAGRHRRVIERLDALVRCPREGLIDAAVLAAGDGATIGELASTLSPSDEGASVAEPLVATRASESFEALRRRAGDLAKIGRGRPRVFLANIGPLAQHKARADFSRGFFEVGGFEVISSDGHATPEEAADAAASSGARIAVLCSTDQTYPALVAPFVSRLKEKKPEAIAVLAGYPKDQVEAHRAAGIDEFIHIAANNLRILVRMMDLAGGAR